MQLKIIILYELRQAQKNLIFPLYMDPRFSINMYNLAKKKKRDRVEKGNSSGGGEQELGNEY